MVYQDGKSHEFVVSKMALSDLMFFAPFSTTKTSIFASKHARVSRDFVKSRDVIRPSSSLELSAAAGLD